MEFVEVFFVLVSMFVDFLFSLELVDGFYLGSFLVGVFFFNMFITVFVISICTDAAADRKV